MTVSKKNVRKRKMLMLLPLLVIPFLTLAFYAMGGGSGDKTQSLSSEKKGLNLKLPDANLKEEKLLDKLSFYDKADKDSAKLAEWMRSDPYYHQKSDSAQQITTYELEQLTQATASKYNQRLNLSPYEHRKQPPEDQVMQKLSLLQKQLDANSTVTPKAEKADPAHSANPEFVNDVDRLEAAMNRMNSGNEEDPEMKQLSSVMDKILDIQHPDRVKQRVKEKESQESSNVFSVWSTNQEDTMAYGFFGLDNEIVSGQSNAIGAVANENQVLVNGAVIKLRLLHDIYIKGSKIPAGNFVFGIVSLNGERLGVEINSIRSGNSLYPVKMEVYDMDGLPGIYIPGAITRDVAKQSADNSLQMMELATLDPSLKARATAAGISAAKSLLSRKAKQVKVMVKAGYKVLLKDNSQK